MQAKDQGGNPDPTPASRSFTVATEVLPGPTPPPTESTPPPTFLPTPVLLPDTAAPDAILFARRSQLAGKPITLTVGCDEDCKVTADGKVVIWLARKAVQSARYGEEDEEHRPQKGHH